MSDPSPNPPPQPFILDYQRVEKKQRTLAMGLQIMGIAIFLFGLLFVAAISVEMMSNRKTGQFLVVSYIVSILITLSGAVGAVCAIHIRRKVRAAAKLALVMTSLQTIAWMISLPFSLRSLYHDGYDTALLILLISAIAFAITAGLIALIVDIIRLLRSPDIWRQHTS